MVVYEYCISETYSIGVTKTCTLSPNCLYKQNKLHKPKNESYRSVRIAFIFGFYSNQSFWLAESSNSRIRSDAVDEYRFKITVALFVRIELTE